MKKQEFIYEPKDVAELIHQDVTASRVRQLVNGLTENVHFKRYGRSILFSWDGVTAISARNTKPGPLRAPKPRNGGGR